MPGNFKSVDCRKNMTRNALQSAFVELLACRSFSRITVNDLCEQACISRPTFYAHFKDKYDLLEYYLLNLNWDLKAKIDNRTFARTERIVNRYIRKNSKVITNILKSANDETVDLLHNFMILYLDIENSWSEDRLQSPEYIVFSNFCAGGMMKILQWQIQNRFPNNLQLVNEYFFSILSHMMEWELDTDITTESGKDGGTGSEQI